MSAAARSNNIFQRFFPIRVVSDPYQSICDVALKYNQPEEVELHSRSISAGLELWELDFLQRFMTRKGSALNIGCGAGREAIALAKAGFDVTGIDMAERMIDSARANATASGADIRFDVKGATDIDYPDKSFDYVIFSRAVYSYIPTKALRVEALRAVRRVLKDGGIAVFSAYYYWRRSWFSRTYPLDLIRASLSFMYGSRFKTEPGDAFLARVSEASDPKQLCYGHYFSSPREIIKEIAMAGLKIIEGGQTGFWIVKP